MAETQGQPRLIAVDEDAPHEESAPPLRSSSARRDWRGWGVWILAAALAVALLLLASQTRRAGQLEAQVGSLRGELRSTRQLVDAHQRHLEAVRGHVDELSANMSALQELVGEDPTSEPEL